MERTVQNVGAADMENELDKDDVKSTLFKVMHSQMVFLMSNSTRKDFFQKYLASGRLTVVHIFLTIFNTAQGLLNNSGFHIKHGPIFKSFFF